MNWPRFVFGVFLTLCVVVSIVMALAIFGVH